jgi:hypothetical protein
MKKQWKTLMQLRFFVKSKKGNLKQKLPGGINIMKTNSETVHELEVHQIELECKMKNFVGHQAKKKLLLKYNELYDFAIWLL